MGRVIKQTEAYYEVKDVKFGKVYRWCSESLVLVCECGERPTLTSSVSSCDGYVTDYMLLFRGVFDNRSPEDEAN